MKLFVKQRSQGEPNFYLLNRYKQDAGFVPSNSRVVVTPISSTDDAYECNVEINQAQDGSVLYLFCKCRNVEQLVPLCVIESEEYNPEQTLSAKLIDFTAKQISQVEIVTEADWTNIALEDSNFCLPNNELDVILLDNSALEPQKLQEEY